MLRIFNPNGSEELNLLPIEQFAQANPGYGFGIGSNYLGSELQPAMDPQTFVSRIVMPRYRRQIGPVTPIGGGELPAVAQAAQSSGMPSQMRAGRFRYSYSLAKRLMEEDVYCVLSYTSAPAVQSVYWSPEQLYSIRAERGQLDQKTKLMPMAFHPTPYSSRLPITAMPRFTRRKAGLRTTSRWQIPSSRLRASRAFRSAASNGASRAPPGTRPSITFSGCA